MEYEVDENSGTCRMGGREDKLMYVVSGKEWWNWYQFGNIRVGGRRIFNEGCDVCIRRNWQRTQINVWLFWYGSPPGRTSVTSSKQHRHMTNETELQMQRSAHMFRQYDWYRVLPGGKAAGTWRWLPTTPSSAEVKERVQLHLYSTSRSSWSILGWTLRLPLPYWSLQFEEKVSIRRWSTEFQSKLRPHTTVGIIRGLMLHTK
jgi:hypothetical protein